MTNILMPRVKMRVIMTIDIDAEDYVEAAEQQKRLDDCVRSLKSEFPALELKFRDHRAGAPKVVQRGSVKSGRVNQYEAY